MAVLGILFSLASTGLSMFAAHSSGKAAKQQAEYSAEIERQRALNTEREFHEQTLRQRRSDRTARSAIVARHGKSGIVGSTGSALNIIGEAAGRQELAIADAARAANQSAQDARSRATMAIYEGNAQASASKLSMLGIGLQGAANTFSTTRQLRYHGAL